MMRFTRCTPRAPRSALTAQDHQHARCCRPAGRSKREPEARLGVEIGAERGFLGRVVTVQPVLENVSTASDERASLPEIELRLKDLLSRKPPVSHTRSNHPAPLPSPAISVPAPCSSAPPSLRFSPPLLPRSPFFASTSSSVPYSRASAPPPSLLCIPPPTPRRSPQPP